MSSEASRNRSPVTIELLTSHIAYQEWLPPKNVPQRDRTAVYLPGFSLSSRTYSANRVGSALSRAGYETSVIYNLPKKIIEDSLPEEARDIRALLSETLHDKHYILVAHSKAATKAIDLTAQKPTGLDGLVLIAPIGLYPQKDRELAKLFTKELIRNSVPSIIREQAQRNLRREDRRTTELAVGVIGTALSELLNFGVLYRRRVRQEVHELAQRSPQRVIQQLQQLSIPLEIVLGGKDKVADPQKIKAILDELGLPNLTITQLETMDHSLPYTHPEVVVTAVTNVENKL